MSGLIAIYIGFLRTSLAVQFQYRVAMIIWMIGLVLEPIIYLAVWRSVAISQGGVVGSFGLNDFSSYYIVLLIVSHFTMVWHMWEYDYIIREGILSGRLLRPIHPIHRDASENIAYKSLMLVILIPSVLLLWLFFQPTLAFSWSLLVLFIMALFLAAVLAFAMGWTLAMAAFWTTRIEAINQVYYIAMMFFAGLMAPLSLLPVPMQMIAHLLPFRWIISFPVELMLGRIESHDLLVGFSMQALWISFFIVALRVAWRNGAKRYSAMGG